jgi:hypothetical protein
MILWNGEIVPDKGWTCKEVIDKYGESRFFTFNAQIGEFYEKCQACGKENIRYVHVMKHPEYPKLLRVGSICAGHMEDNSDAPKERERKVTNRQNLKMNFLSKDWKYSKNDNQYLMYNGKCITIMKSKYNSSEYGIMYDEKYYSEYNRMKFKNLTDAKFAAFEIVNPLYVEWN